MKYSDVEYPKETKRIKETKENERAGIVKVHYYLAPASDSSLIFTCLPFIWNWLWFLEINVFSSFKAFSQNTLSLIFFFLNAFVVSRMASKDIQALISGICGYAASHSKRDFADIIKVTVFKIREIILDFPFGPNLITWSLKGRELSPVGVREMWQEKSERFEVWEKLKFVSEIERHMEIMRRNKSSLWEQRLASGWQQGNEGLQY